MSRLSALPATPLTGLSPHCHPGYGRAAVAAQVDRWCEHPTPASDDRAVLVVLDVDLDRALPADEQEDRSRRHRLGARVEHALRRGGGPGDAVTRIDHGRFAVLRTTAAGDARALAGLVAHEVEQALTGRPEGRGARVTVGATLLARGVRRGGRATLGAVTGAMLAGKLLSDDRVVVVVAPGG